MYTSFRLHPGESFRTSSVVLLEYRDGQAAAHNVWRRYLRERVSPIGQSGGARGTQCPFSSLFWGGISTEALLRRWQALFDAGMSYALSQIIDLLANDVDGIHLYTMNNPYVARKITEAVGGIIKASKC